MVDQPYIGFEGPIGAGKTTLTQLLASYIGATPVYENVDGNEFLADFYGDKQRWALGMQLSFLISRHNQLKSVVQSRDNAVVADYTQAKDATVASYSDVGFREFENRPPSARRFFYPSAALTSLLIDRLVNCNLAFVRRHRGLRGPIGRDRDRCECTEDSIESVCGLFHFLSK